MAPMRRSKSYVPGGRGLGGVEKQMSDMSLGAGQRRGGGFRNLPGLSRARSAPQDNAYGRGGRRWSNGNSRFGGDNHFSPTTRRSPNFAPRPGGSFGAIDATLPPQLTPPQPETSHVFLAIAADPALVNYSAEIQRDIVNLPEVPEITSLNDSRCIWPHTVHLTIHSFGKVLNADIPRIAEYSKENINVLEDFTLNIGGLFHHQRLHTVGFSVEKQTVEPLKQMKANMLTWFNKGNNWDMFTPVFSVLRTQTPRGAKFSCNPLSKKSIDVIIEKFGNVKYTQKVQKKDIQLCLARTSTETTFYKNLLLEPLEAAGEEETGAG